MQAAIVLVIDQLQNIEIRDYGIFVNLAAIKQRLKMWLHNNRFKLVKDLLLVFGVFAEGKDQVLGGYAARLRASEEESQALVDYTHCTVLKMLINQ